MGVFYKRVQNNTKHMSLKSVSELVLIFIIKLPIIIIINKIKIYLKIILYKLIIFLIN